MYGCIKYVCGSICTWELNSFNFLHEQTEDGVFAKFNILIVHVFKSTEESRRSKIKM
jgi:hypothetical protein